MFYPRLLSSIWFLMCLVAAAMDPYQVLQIGRDADEKTIKSAYRRLSKQYHPDKNPDPKAHDKFLEVGEAYDILSDEKKKSNFDRFGDANAGAGGGGGPGFGGFDDILSQFFNGQGGHGHPGKRRGGDTNVKMQISLKDYFVGRDVDFSVEMNNICETCTGSGSADGKRNVCSKCNGQGVVTVRRQMGPMVQQFQTHCDQCQGQGSTIAHKCKTCGGGGIVRKARDYNFFVSAGTPRYYTHTFEGEGDQHPELVPGNLNLQLSEHPHLNWGFRRIGNNLYRSELLTAKEAQHGGWSREVKMFDDETVTLRRDPGQVIIDGQVDVLEGHGMPIMNDDEYGNLYVEYRVLPSFKKGERSGKDEL